MSTSAKKDFRKTFLVPSISFVLNDKTGHGLIISELDVPVTINFFADPEGQELRESFVLPAHGTATMVLDDE